MLLFMDGMAHYDTPRIGMKYSVLTQNDCTWAVTAEGRYGNCIKRVATSNGFAGSYLDIAPLTNRSGVYVPTPSGVFGFAVKVDDLSRIQVDEAGGMVSFFSVLQGPNWAVKINLNPTGTFSYVQPWGPLNSYGAVMATSAEGLQSGAWSYVEIKWIINATTGLIEIRVNTVPVLTFSGDTSSHNPAWFSLGTWNTVRVLNLQANYTPPNWLTTRHCDLYLADLTSGDSDDVSDFLGDGVIQCIVPNGPGGHTDWTPSGTNNWDMVNDRPAPDDDATYNATTFPGGQDTYNYENIPPLAEVKGAQMVWLARKEAEGSATLQPIVRQGGVDYLGPAQGVASLVYDRYDTQPYDLNPATMAKFTAAEINSGEFGLRKIL